MFQAVEVCLSAGAPVDAKQVWYWVNYCEIHHKEKEGIYSSFTKIQFVFILKFIFNT